MAESLLPLTAFVTTLFVTRWLGPVEYGVFTLAASIGAVVEWLAIAPLAHAPVKLLRLADDWRPAASALLRAHLVLGLFAFTTLALGGPVFAALFDEPRLGFALLLLSPE